MLAWCGWTFPQVAGKLPVAWTADVSTNPLEAQYQLPNEIYAQLFLSMAIAEGLRAKKIFDPATVPGEHGFGDWALKNLSPEQVQRMKLREIQHCRLAMIAITGCFFEQMITGHVIGVN